MRCRVNTYRRRGAAAVEAAFVLPVVVSLILAIIYGGVAVFKYQEAAYIARETARFAAVHGNQYAVQNASAIAAGTLPIVDKDYLVSYAKSKALTIDTSQIQITVTMTVITPGATAATTTETVDWDSTTDNQNRSPYSVWTDKNATPPANVQVSNLVTVTVSYNWDPGVIFGPFSLGATAVEAMSY